MTGPLQQLPDDQYLTLADAETLLGRSRQTILAMAIRGDVVALPIGGKIFVTRASADAYLAQARATIDEEDA